MSEERAVAHAVLVRPFRDVDYPGAVAVGNAANPDLPFTEADWRHQDSRYDGERLVLGRLVAEADGAIVAFATYRHHPESYHPRRFMIEIVVHPAHRRLGIGARLYDALLEAAAPRAPLAWLASLQETSDAGIRFVRRRGFEEVRRVWELRLDVAGFDPAPFADRARRAEAGVEIVALADERARDPEWLTKLYDLHLEAAADVPRVDPFTPPPLDQYVKEYVGHPGWLADGAFVARAGGRYVAECQLFRSLQLSGMLYHRLTGTRRAYRGRGLALALKLRAIARARAGGYREIRTWNDSLNTPILRLNAALGYARQPAWIFFERRG